MTLIKVSNVYICSTLETRDLIIEAALHHFKRKGVKNVSMDDIAKELRISKKTLYQHCGTKEDLVLDVFQFDLGRKQQICFEAISSSSNAIEQLLSISIFINNSLEDITPQVLDDIDRYYPKCKALLEDFSHGFVYDFLRSNLRDGIAQGYYRDNLDINTVCQFYIYLINGLIPNTFTLTREKGVASFHKELYTYHLHAICSDKGVEFLKNHLKA